MKPQQVNFRAGFQFIELRAKRLMILAYCIASVSCAVKTNPVCIRLVIVRGSPIRSHVFGCIPRTGTIMMVPCKNMMKSQRHHIIDGSLAALKHHLFYGNQEEILPIARI